MKRSDRIKALAVKENGTTRYSGRRLGYLAVLALVGSAVSAANKITPNDHFKIEQPASLTGDQAESIYRNIAGKMRDGYTQSQYPSAADYQQWQRFNTAPYLSPGHGNRFLNNYGNRLAKDYLQLKNGETLPAGAILAKDSFTVTAAEQVHPGALFLMEKLPEGASAATADWRYVMLLPDGSVLGDTNGANPASMDFCHACHQQAKNTDYLFLLPQALHRKP